MQGRGKFSMNIKNYEVHPRDTTKVGRRTFTRSPHSGTCPVRLRLRAFYPFPMRHQMTVVPDRTRPCPAFQRILTAAGIDNSVSMIMVRNGPWQPGAALRDAAHGPCSGGPV